MGAQYKVGQRIAWQMEGMQEERKGQVTGIGVASLCVKDEWGNTDQVPLSLAAVRVLDTGETDRTDQPETKAKPADKAPAKPSRVCGRCGTPIDTKCGRKWCKDCSKKAVRECKRRYSARKHQQERDRRALTVSATPPPVAVTTGAAESAAGASPAVTTAPPPPAATPKPPAESGDKSVVAPYPKDLSDMAAAFAAIDMYLTLPPFLRTRVLRMLVQMEPRQN